MNLQELNELDLENVGSWPMPVKIIVSLIVAVLICAGGYYYVISDAVTSLSLSTDKEHELKTQFEM